PGKLTSGGLKTTATHPLTPTPSAAMYKLGAFPKKPAPVNQSFTSITPSPLWPYPLSTTNAPSTSTVTPKAAVTSSNHGAQFPSTYKTIPQLATQISITFTYQGILA